MVAGDQQAPLRLMKDYVGGRVSRGLVHLPFPQVGRDLDAGKELAIGRHRPRQPGALTPARLAVLLERRRGHTALARDLDPPLQRRLRVLEPPRVLPGRVNPQLASGRIDDWPGEPVVVAVG